ncbi:hypothetical protein RSAG8_10766, partial [Rhizoctonia solani AG-8 WAC10335]
MHSLMKAWLNTMDYDSARHGSIYPRFVVSPKNRSEHECKLGLQTTGVDFPEQWLVSATNHKQSRPPSMGRAQSVRTPTSSSSAPLWAEIVLPNCPSSNLPDAFPCCGLCPGTTAWATMKPSHTARLV